MHRIKRLVRAVIRGFFALLGGVVGKRRFLRLVRVVGSEIDTTLVNEGIRFEAGDAIPYHRAVTLLTKEPETIAWIDDVFEDGDTFYDVGANVGVFSLYAALRKNATVISFEPSADNFSVLNRNIHLNNLSDRITALNLAMHNVNMLSRLDVSEMRPGKAGHTFDATAPGDGSDVPEFKQGVLGLRLDHFVREFQQPFPSHVKIDVDGNDLLVLEGMEGILADERLRSIAIEINPEAHEADRGVADKLIGHGFERLIDDRYRNETYIARGIAHNYFFVRR